MTNEILDLVRHYSKQSDAYIITYVQTYIDNVPFTVELLDNGNEGDSNRFIAYAYRSDLPLEDREGNSAVHSIGNTDATAAGAIENIHWYQLKGV